jgi:hypothetical protein
LWSVTPSGTVSGFEFGPFEEWHAYAISVGPDNNTRVLWRRTDGAISLWSVTPSGTVSGFEFGPF